MRVLAQARRADPGAATFTKLHDARKREFIECPDLFLSRLQHVQDGCGSKIAVQNGALANGKGRLKPAEPRLLNFEPHSDLIASSNVPQAHLPHRQLHSRL